AARRPALDRARPQSGSRERRIERGNETGGDAVTWVVVGRERSGDEDEKVSVVEAFGPFSTFGCAVSWRATAPTFDGKVLKFSVDVGWLLDLFGVRFRDPNVNAKGSA